jgi:hypothetical protein
MKSKATTPDYDMAVQHKEDRWVAACGGKEQPFKYRGCMYLYCFNPARWEWQYINLETDMPENLTFEHA